jgi:3-phosphoshikimate 1-carboxyvinyltransferase
MRHLAGILSTSSIRVTLTGDASLSKRPMQRLVDPLEALGGSIAVSPDGTAPLVVGGAHGVHGANYEIAVASAQVRTAFQYAALAADSPSTIDSPGGFRDHTERWLEAIGRGHWSSATAFTVDPGPLPPARYEIPGDPSSAAYLWAAAAIERGAVITTPGVSLNPGRLGFLQILDEMGAIVNAEVTGSTGGDPVGTVTVEGGDLHGISVGGDLVASSLDELPLVAVVAAFAEGITSVSDATELRAKESDRIDAVVAMLRALEGGIETRPDGFDVVGTGFLAGGTIDTALDHRIAMAGAVAATKALDSVIITDAEVASVSWPGFYATLESLWS